MTRNGFAGLLGGLVALIIMLPVTLLIKLVKLIARRNEGKN